MPLHIEFFCHDRKRWFMFCCFLSKIRTEFMDNGYVHKMNLLLYVLYHITYIKCQFCFGMISNFCVSNTYKAIIRVTVHLQWFKNVYCKVVRVLRVLANSKLTRNLKNQKKTYIPVSQTQKQILNSKTDLTHP